MSDNSAPTINEHSLRKAHAAPSPLIAVPEPGLDLGQDEEWILVEQKTGWKKVRLHDYAKVFAVPGLYEKVVYDICQCRSPEVVRRLLAERLEEERIAPSTLKVLDLGAGNGCVAEELGKIGVKHFVGLDIHEEAKEAAERDRPGLYEDYLIGDLSDPDDQVIPRLHSHYFNSLVCVAALGFADIPPLVFARAFNSVERDGWIAFTIKPDFVKNGERTGFAGLIRRLLEDGRMELCAEELYTHRHSIHRDPIKYLAYIGRKVGDVDLDRFRR